MINWVPIADRLPEEYKPVFLIKFNNHSISEADIGYLLTSDDGKEQGFFVDNDEKVLKLHARHSWSYINENNLGMPDLLDDQLEPFVHLFLERLRLFDEKFRRMASWMIRSGNGSYALDYYISGILNRSLSLIYGFETLIVSRNFIAAAHLVRPHLDNYLRLNAAWLSKKPHDFAYKVWMGEQVGNIKDRDGNLMRDKYLKEKATERYPWMKNVYDETSGFVHFSAKHIRNATSFVKRQDEYFLQTFIGKTDNDVSNEHKIEAIIGMIETCNAIADAVFGWIDTKRIKG